MRIPLPEQTLLQFLRTSLQVHQHFLSGALKRADSPIYVIGNPSADLDSIISAIVYSYFANGRVPRDYPRPHFPLINLDNVSVGSELRRLRPEFLKALELSHPEETSEIDNPTLKELFLTVADFRTQLEGADKKSQIEADSVLVDWNALPVRPSDNRSGKGSLPSLPVEFNVLGCIDHHEDEKFLAPIADTQPHLIMPTGSCTSLVISELERMGLWQKVDKIPSEEQLAKLSLAPILIDTINLTAESKVTKFDTLAYDFLLPKATGSDKTWSSDGFFAEIDETKQNSLDLLTVDEMLGRDYKEWDEASTRHPDQPTVRIGICSMVKSLPWIVRKAGNSQSFLDSLEAFSSERNLDVISVMTAFNSAEAGEFSRELLVRGRNKWGADAMKHFASDSTAELGLEHWHSLDGDDGARDITDHLNASKDDCWMQIWLQTNLAKSRKQVAPLIRGAAASL
ncbi:putative exopolyphosphatase [Aspergillus undulatus]|uniref:putative exopolyphosphatase n=1 Tax=Aspergillus undulatus TaxID=1810928 RepID=UPI003CCD82E5